MYWYLHVYWQTHFFLFFFQVLESIWMVLKGNMNLVFNLITAILSLVFGGGTAILNFVLSTVYIKLFENLFVLIFMQNKIALVKKNSVMTKEFMI